MYQREGRKVEIGRITQLGLQKKSTYTETCNQILLTKQDPVQKGVQRGSPKMPDT